jgi:hypothetical protein
MHDPGTWGRAQSATRFEKGLAIQKQILGDRIDFSVREPANSRADEKMTIA